MAKKQALKPKSKKLKGSAFRDWTIKGGKILPSFQLPKTSSWLNRPREGFTEFMRANELERMKKSKEGGWTNR